MVFRRTFDLTLNGKTARLEARINKKTKEALSKLWGERLYPKPFHQEKEIPFNSMSEYLEFLISATNKMDDEAWRYFSHWNNPSPRHENDSED